MGWHKSKPKLSITLGRINNNLPMRLPVRLQVIAITTIEQTLLAVFSFNPLGHVLSAFHAVMAQHHTDKITPAMVI